MEGETREEKRIGLESPDLPGCYSGNLLVERKSFRFWATNGKMRVDEIRGNGARFVLLSLDQFSWCLKSLLVFQSQVVGSCVKGRLVSLFGQRHSQGSFVKVQARNANGFIFILIGWNGEHLVGFASCFARRCLLVIVHRHDLFPAISGNLDLGMF